MDSIRRTLGDIAPNHSSLREVLRDEFGAPGPRISLQAQLERADDYDAAIIFVHGVNTDPNWNFRNMERELRARWPEQMRRVAVVKLFWGYVPGNEWSSVIGTRTDQTWGLSDLAWSGPAKLCDAIGRVQATLGVDTKICVMAYSQGTCITVAALQEGLEIDNLILMGSPLDQGGIVRHSHNTHLPQAFERVRGEIINCSSDSDWMSGVGAGTSAAGSFFAGGGLNGKSVGGHGLPKAIKDLPKVHSLHLDNVDHTVLQDEGWWDAHWIRPGGDNWQGISPEHFIRVATCANHDKRPHAASPRELEALDEHREHLIADTRRGWSDERGSGFSDRVYIPAKTTMRWHHDDRHHAEYSVEAIDGFVIARLCHAVYDDFSCDERWLSIGMKEGPKGGARSVSGSEDATFMLEVNNTRNFPTVVDIKFRTWRD